MPLPWIARASSRSRVVPGRLFAIRPPHKQTGINAGVLAQRLMEGWETGQVFVEVHDLATLLAEKDFTVDQVEEHIVSSGQGGQSGDVFFHEDRRPPGPAIALVAAK